MTRRPAARALPSQSALLSLVALALLATAPAALAAPAVTRVVSRMTHGGVPCDIPMPQTGAGGIECRSAAPGMTIVVQFDQPVNVGTAAVTAGAATRGAVTFNGAEMSIPLTAVANAQTVTLALTNVAATNPLGGTLPAATVSFRVLAGDVNGSGSVTVADINLTKFKAGALTPANVAANFRYDVDRNNAVGASDLTAVKLAINTAVGAPAVNSAPTLSDIADQSTAAGAATPPIAFTVGDAESDPASLAVTVTSSDPTLTPTIAVGGAGATRTVTVTPGSNPEGPMSGTATLTVTVSDGVLVTTDSFILTVGSAQKLYVATLRPESSAVSTPATGWATLVVDAAETTATLRFGYSNLTTNKTAAHIHGPADPGQIGGIVFDIDTATPGEDGSYTWTLAQVGNTTIQDLKDALHAGRLYINIHTVTYPDGEIRGHFNFATGSTTFTPPPPPPPLPGGPLSDADAVRFLTQASFGALPDDTAPRNPAVDNPAVGHPHDFTIPGLQNLGIDPWLEKQFNTPTSSMVELIKPRLLQVTPLYPLEGRSTTELWWNIALTKPDQLRQRVAFAYSQIFVVSRNEEAIEGQPMGLLSYHDMLANNAFANFRTVLKDVTLHPIMGQYLNMRGSRKQTSATSPPPNENYAREILQLFSIGLNALHPDGTLKLDANGSPIPTYDQETISNFAQVFTGWNTNPTLYPYQWYDSATQTTRTSNSSYVNPMTVRSGDHATVKKTLLNGFVIPAAASMNSTLANQELDQALDNIFNHPNVGPFIARRLIQRLVTSNPSPGYIYRVAEVFRNNGQGTRGDMKAVVRAILTDYEARTTTLVGNAGYGRLKEPVLKLAQVIRAFHFTSNAVAPNPQYFRLSSTNNEFLQTPYDADTVFNFYEPDFTLSLRLTNPKNGQTFLQPLNAPELQILNENTSINTANLFKTGLVDLGSMSPSSNGSDVRLRLTFEQGLASAPTGDALVNHLNRLLMAGQMPANMQTALKTHYTTTSDTLKRAKWLSYLVAASPQFAAQK
jgi:uncharacterized protein (DUF1800 family)